MRSKLRVGPQPICPHSVRFQSACPGHSPRKKESHSRTREEGKRHPRDQLTRRENEPLNGKRRETQGVSACLYSGWIVPGAIDKCPSGKNRKAKCFSSFVLYSPKCLNTLYTRMKQ